MRCKFLVVLSIVVANTCAAQTYEQEIKKAEGAYEKNQLDSCILWFNNAFGLGSAKGSDLYNAAICNTLNGNIKQAFELLNKGIKAGINVSKMKIDPDLEVLHDKKNWKRLVKKARQIQKKEFKKTQFPGEAKKLAELWEKDQYWRFRLGSAYNKNDTVTANIIWKKLKPLDSINLIQFQAIMDRIGWPTATKVGKPGAGTAFLIIDHSPREIMEKYFPLLEIAAKNGEASLSGYATMKDRILVNRGKKQVYGTQRYWDSTANKFVFFPIEDEKNVNTKRKEAGLEPLPEFN
jgi:hypothetical protein